MLHTQETLLNTFIEVQKLFLTKNVVKLTYIYIHFNKMNIY